MHILHITGSYGGTEVYKNLFSSLDKLGIRQTVFVPLNVGNHDRVGNHSINFEITESRIVYSVALKSYHRFLYWDKINVIVKEIERNIDLSDVDVIHSATLCVEGAVAYELKKKYNIPYLTAVRNTDISTYYKYFKWRFFYFFKIFNEASNVVFICPQYLKFYMEKYVPEKMLETEKNKVLVIPNGVDTLFLERRCKACRIISDPIKIVFASAFVRNKSLKEIIEGIAILRQKGYNIRFEAIGKGLPFRKENRRYIAYIEKLSKKYDWIALHDYMEKSQLMETFLQSHIYVMPSKPETFGLVYVEALSQGLPIVYGSGQGFDGYFDESYVGYSAKAFNAYDIAEKIELVVRNYNKISSNINGIDLANLFSWESVSNKYWELYRKIIQG